MDKLYNFIVGFSIVLILAAIFFLINTILAFNDQGLLGSESKGMEIAYSIVAVLATGFAGLALYLNRDKFLDDVKLE